MRMSNKIMAQLRYKVVLTPEEKGYSVEVPDLPGCITQGDSLEEALSMAKEAIECHIEGLEKDGDPIPLPKIEEVVEVNV